MSMMYAQMGLSVMGAATNYLSAGIRADMQKAARKHQEAMAGIAAGQQLNALTSNEIAARDQAIQIDQSLQVQAMRDRASAEVAAAAAGVKGGSVKSAMQGLARSKMQARFALQQRIKAQARADAQQRRNIGLQRIFAQNPTPIAQPSVASSLLGLGASLVDIYNSHQPEGQQIEDKLASWGRR